MRIGTLDQVLDGARDTARWNGHLELAAELGFEGMEPGLRADYDQTQIWNRQGRQELRSVSARTGVVTPSICLHSYWTYSFASPDAAVRMRARQIAEEAALVAAELGARCILVPLTCPDGVDADDARMRWADGVKSAAPAAEENGIFFCLENVGKPFAMQAADIAGIVDEIDSPAVGVYYDPGNSVLAEIDPIQAIRHLGARIKQVHVKENGGILLGEGRVPWRQIIDELRSLGYDGWLILETKTTDDPRSAALYNLAHVQQLIND